HRRSSRFLRIKQIQYRRVHHSGGGPGDVYALFEHIEPRAAGLPNWLDLDVPDDRFIASALLVQSRHPGSKLYTATSDLNLQTKLAAVGLPFVEGPASV
ncbi:hypothetical protein, partial [Streptomyces chryseus]|uniref:hypothetical protein n=1 Tax=Streptomyces chryseus TaxID=68186 RepID=UPI001E523E83